MSRYSKTVIFIFLLFLYGCSTTTPKQPQVVMSGKRVFKDEDTLIIRALEYERLRKYDDAIKCYDELYKKSGKKEYLLEESKLSFLVHNDENTYNLLKEGIRKYPDELSFKRLLTGYYMKRKEYKKAEKVALELVAKDRIHQHLEILADIYLREKEYKLALKYFQSAFKESKSESVLLSMVDLLYRFLDRKKDAISYLETYIRMNNASKEIYYTLIRIYGQQKDIDGLISTYKKLYKRFGDDEYAKKAIELMMYKKDVNGAIDFLKKSGYNKKLLLDIYIKEKRYKDAYEVALSLYKETGKIDYLGRAAIFEYESNKDRLNKKIFDSILKKFETVVEKYQLPLYLNYYGYLLIDHNLDIEKGIKLVKMALQKEPESPFYLDSLAWGYYKLGKCVKALEVMEKFIKETNEPEIIMHYDKIKECVKRENR